MAVVAAAAAVGISVAGCTTGASTSAAPPATPTTAASSAAVSSPAASNVASPTASPVSSPNATSAASPPAVSASAPPNAAPACPTRYLSAKAGLSQGTAGSIYQVIDFTNISNAPCTLYGYPGVSLASGTPVTQVGAAATRSTATAATLVTLAPGQTANALLRIVEAGNYSATTCSPTNTTYIQIYPPNQTTPIYLGYTSTGCASTGVKLLSVSVVTAGSGG
ncbi:MAG: DUF4232 domain-containing protein [Trebonia sp.]